MIMAFGDFHHFIVNQVLEDLNEDACQQGDFILDSGWLLETLQKQIKSLSGNNSGGEKNVIDDANDKNDTDLTRNDDKGDDDERSFYIWFVYFFHLFPRQFHFLAVSSSSIESAANSSNILSIRDFLIQASKHVLGGGREEFRKLVLSESAGPEEPSLFFTIHHSNPSKSTQETTPSNTTMPPLYIIKRMGRFCNYVNVLHGFFPSFMQKLWQASILPLFHQTSGPLPLPWRHYLAMIAAAQYSNHYFIHLHRIEFLNCGGDSSWIISSSSNAKLSGDYLNLVNGILAHQPWRLTREIVFAWYKSASWTMAELVQAVTIMCHVHSLCSFVDGCGIAPEPDQFLTFMPESDLSNKEAFTKRLLAEIMKNADNNNNANFVIDKESSETTTSMIISQLKNGLDADAVNAEKNNQEFFDSDPREDNSNNIGLFIKDPTAPQHCTLPFLSSSIEDPMKHEDFDVKSNDYKVLRLQDFNWEDQGCCLINKYLPNMGDGMDSEFSEAFNMTDFSVCDDHSIDTSPVRQAVWYYVLRLSGMCHDDFNYALVNRFLPRKLKSFVKKVVFQPHLIADCDFRDVGLSLRPDEKVHICILASEAKKQAALLYFLRHLDQ